jgi:sorting nexin-4
MSSPTDPLDDGFTSISWDNKPSQAEHPHSTLHTLTSADPPSVVEAETRPEALKHAQREGEGTVPSWAGRYMAVDVGEPSKEMEGTKEVYISYAVRTRVSSMSFLYTWPL